MFISLALTGRGLRPAFILICAILTFVLSEKASADEDGISYERKSELVQLVRNDCGSCHGLALRGGLGPALLPEDLRGKMPDGLIETILRGRTGTAMPPWSAFISEFETKWIVEQLMKGFPDAH